MSRYAIIETGSKQYKVEPKSVIEVELLEIPEGKKEVALNRVLLVKDGEKVHIGNPVLSGASVVCDFLGNTRSKKTVHFRFRRRKNSRKKHGHRQDLIKLQVKDIVFKA